MRRAAVLAAVLTLAACGRGGEKKGEAAGGAARPAVTSDATAKASAAADAASGPSAGGPGAGPGGTPASDAAPSEATTDPTATARPLPTGPIPYYFDRPITKKDLEGRTLRELTLMRNTIYARLGNRFRKKWLNDHFAAQPWYRPLPAGHRIDESKLSPLDRKNARVIAEYEWSIPFEEAERRIRPVQERLKKGPVTLEDKVEFRLLAEHLGSDSDVLDYDVMELVDPTPLSDPRKLDRLLTVAELDDMSQRDLRILRNLVYARRGRMFKSAVLTEIFSSYEWYRPDPAYTDARLTPVDRKNIRLIRSVEDSIGGPLAEKEHADEFFSGA